MEVFDEYLDKIDNPEHKARMTEILQWVSDTYPQLGKRIGWNQPMFTDHGTFIIAFSMSKNHISVSPERAGMIQFEDEIKEAGYDASTMLMRIPWKDDVNYELLGKMIEYNIAEKADYNLFWRKSDSKKTGSKKTRDTSSK